MKKYVLLLSIIINYFFCYGDESPSWEPYKKISENGKYFCWIDFNDNDTAKYEWKRKWILKVYNKDSVLFWQKKYNSFGYSDGMLSNDGRKFIYVEYWYYSDYAVVQITSKENPDIYIKGSEFNIPEKYLIETVSHKLWLNDYFLSDNELIILTLNRKVWVIDIETGVTKLSENGFWDLWGTDFWSFYLILYSPFIIGAMSIIKTIGNVRKKRLFFSIKYRNNTKKQIRIQ